MDRGGEGQVVAAFIGRSEMNHVQMLSAPHNAFIPPTPRGLRRMRHG